MCVFDLLRQRSIWYASQQRCIDEASYIIPNCIIIIIRPITHAPYHRHHIPTDQDTALYAAYTQEVIGQSLQGPPDIICGYWTSVAAIRYGEPPLAPAACQSGDLSYNAPRYGVRAVDLPIGKYWPITTADVQVWELDAGDLDLEPLNYRQNCPESPVTLPVPALSSGFPFDAYWLVNIAISPYWYANACDHLVHTQSQLYAHPYTQDQLAATAGHLC